MSGTVSINEALKLVPRTPPRQMTGYKRALNPASPPDTTSTPKVVDLSDIHQRALSAQRKEEAWARAAQRARAANRGGKSRRKGTKKSRKTRKVRKSRK